MGEAAIVHAGEPMARVAQETPQHRIVNLGHDMVVEYGLAAALENRARQSAAQQTADQTLGAQVRTLEFGGKTEKELPQVDVGEGAPHRDARQRGAQLVGLHGDG